MAADSGLMPVAHHAGDFPRAPLLLPHHRKLGVAAVVAAVFDVAKSVNADVHGWRFLSLPTEERSAGKEELALLCCEINDKEMQVKRGKQHLRVEPPLNRPKLKEAEATGASASFVFQQISIYTISLKGQRRTWSVCHQNICTCIESLHQNHL